MLNLSNTLTRRLEPFTPLRPDRVGLYTCGPTVYSTAHIGNLRTYIFEDVLRRTLEFDGYRVTHVMNITDVGHLTSDADTGEDKVERAAREAHTDARSITRAHEAEFFHDEARLNILRPHRLLRATETIDLQIDLIRKLEANGLTYRTSDGVYFDTSKFPPYGALGRQKLSEKKAGARVEVRSEKKHPTDFALWKFSKPEDHRQMEWPSPWGTGFPGWHIECSAMSMHELGEQFDLHCGGIDHIPVHHENEIAQSEAATGKRPFVRYWLHSEFLVFDPLEGLTLINNRHQCPKGHWNLVRSKKDYIRHEESGSITLKVKCERCGIVFPSGIVKRMGKSEGNTITLDDVVGRGFHPLAFRYLCLQTNYRSKLQFTWEALEAAQRGLSRLWLFVNAAKAEPRIGCADYEQRFRDAIDHDLDTPRALAVLHDLLRSDQPVSAQLQSLRTFDRVLGLNLSIGATRDHFQPMHEVIRARVDTLIRTREAARAEQDWRRADELRKQINAMLQPFHQTLEDTPSGPVVRPTAPTAPVVDGPSDRP